MKTVFVETHVFCNASRSWRRSMQRFCFTGSGKSNMLAAMGTFFQIPICLYSCCPNFRFDRHCVL